MIKRFVTIGKEKIKTSFNSFKNISKHKQFMFTGNIIAIMFLLMLDPDAGVITSLPFGSGVVAMFAILSKIFIYVTLLAISVDVFLDYIIYMLDDLDVGDAINKAKETSTGSALILVSIALISIAVAVTVLALSTH